MSVRTKDRWEQKKTDESKGIETLLRERGAFDRVDAYEYNWATIRVRVIDKRFKDLPIEKRDAMVERFLKILPEATQRKIVTLLTFAPDELDSNSRSALMNLEFEKPSPSRL